MGNTKSYYNGLGNYTDLLGTIFEFYPEGVACKDSQLRYINANPEYYRIFSIKTPENLLARSENPALSAENIKLINDADNEIKNSIHSLSYVINDRGKILSITSSPVTVNDKFTGIISSVKDITQEENIKTEFVNRHFKQISTEKQLQAQRETFVASIGHDLKNPTIAQIRSLELLLKGVFGKLSGEQSELLEMILDSCRYMNGMLSSLLTTYRNYGGAVKLNFTEFSLTELLNECVSEMMYVARDKSLVIKTKTNDSTMVYADRVQIKRVIMNLLSNAIKYAYKNTDLNLSIFGDGEIIHFEFENRSPYIPEERRKSIFARYVSYAGVHRELGIGLGLYASKKIIESHNGKIYVKSFKDDKNIFGFQIPIKQKSGQIKEVLL